MKIESPIRLGRRSQSNGPRCLELMGNKRILGSGFLDHEEAVTHEEDRDEQGSLKDLGASPDELAAFEKHIIS